MFMYLDVKPSVVFQTHYRMEKIQCYANGAFSINVKRLQDGEDKLMLADYEGNFLSALMSAQRGVLLYDLSYILLGEKAVNKFSGSSTVFNGTNPTGKVYDKKGHVLVSGFEDFKVYQNGWYMLIFKDHKELYTFDGRLVAKDFIECEVLTRGHYALRTDSQLYQFGDYKVYNTSSKLVAKYDRVVAFLSDNVVLQKSKEDETYTLVKGKEELIFGIVGYKKFFNGKFALTFKNGASAMYDGEANRLSTYTGKKAVFLPDGTFVSYSQKIVDTRYRSTGLMIKGEIFQCEEASNYFLLTKESKTELYNDEGKVIAENVLLASVLGNFALFQKEDRYHLYNQYGKVIEFNVS